MLHGPNTGHVANHSVVSNLLSASEIENDIHESLEFDQFDILPHGATMSLEDTCVLRRYWKILEDTCVFESNAKTVDDQCHIPYQTIYLTQRLGVIGHNLIYLNVHCLMNMI